MKAPYGRQHMSVFHLACPCQSGFLSLTLNYLILSGGSGCSKAPRRSVAAGGGGAGPGAGRPDSNLGCRGCAVAARGPVKIVWAASAGRPPIRTAHRPVLRRPRSRGSNWEHKCPAFLLLLSFFFTNLKEILLWTDPCLPLS